jgi:hypothetical protein
MGKGNEQGCSGFLAACALAPFRLVWSIWEAISHSLQATNSHSSTLTPHPPSGVFTPERGPNRDRLRRSALAPAPQGEPSSGWYTDESGRVIPHGLEPWNAPAERRPSHHSPYISTLRTASAPAGHDQPTPPRPRPIVRSQQPARSSGRHSPPPKPDSRHLLPCPECHAYVRSDRLSKHLAKVHREPPRPRTPKPEVPTRPHAEEEGYRSPTRSKTESFLQSHDETRFGGKYLGQVRREGDGKFGSLPLFEDHDDEARPE